MYREVGRFSPSNITMQGSLTRNSTLVDNRVTAILRCPNCSGTLAETEHSFACQSCGTRYPVTNGVIQFVSSEDYVSNFGYEWSKYRRTQLDCDQSRMSEEVFRRKTGFSPEELRGKWVLDAGCGMGRFAEVASRWGANVVAVDLSRAAEVTAQNLADRDNVWVCRADLRRLPFAIESFDYVYSIGVLHHTPDCERTFKGLVPFLKPGGAISIWLYSSYNKWYRMSDVYRRITTGLPDERLHTLCCLADWLYYVHMGLRRSPRLGRFLSGVLIYLLPIPLYSNRESRLLDMFDWYSPKYQSKHTYEEVSRWFEECGLRDLRVLFEPVALQGHRNLD
jgi:SAM-dependent methyltransferase